MQRLGQREIVSEIGVDPSVITCRNNVITRRYWTRRQEQVKLVENRRSRTDLTSRRRQRWNSRFLVVGFDKGYRAGVWAMVNFIHENSRD